jgi:MFS family permease
LVLGLLTASSATGQLIFLPLASYLIVHHGWRVAITPVFIACISAAGLAFLFLQDRPSALGLAPYGADAGPLRAPMPAQRTSFFEPLRVLSEASRTATFWVLFGTFFVCGLSTNGLIQTHFISLCGDYGLAAVPAASVLAMIGGFDFVGTIASGWLSDRFDNRKLLFWYYGLRGISLLWLPHSDFSLYGLSLFAMFYGLDWVATVPPTVKLASASFGKERGADFWVGIRRPPTRRCRCGLRCRLVANPVADIHPGALRGGHRLPPGSLQHSPDPAALIAAGFARRGSRDLELSCRRPSRGAARISARPPGGICWWATTWDEHPHWPRGRRARRHRRRASRPLPS